MLAFPDDFLDSDGQFRGVSPADGAPILYVTSNDTHICTACLDGLDQAIESGPSNGRSRRPVTSELLVAAAEVRCEHRSRALVPLHDDALS